VPVFVILFSRKEIAFVVAIDCVFTPAKQLQNGGAGKRQPTVKIGLFAVTLPEL
jgi:hypothetical protein